MLHTLAEIRSALDGTPLADREMIALDVPDSSEAIAIHIAATEVLDAWRIARTRLDATGRALVGRTTWFLHERP